MNLLAKLIMGMADMAYWVLGFGGDPSFHPWFLLLMIPSATALPTGRRSTALSWIDMYDSAMDIFLTVAQDWIIPIALIVFFVAVLSNPKNFRHDGEYVSGLLSLVFSIFSAMTHTDTTVRGPTRWVIFLVSIAYTMLYTHIVCNLYEIRKSRKGRVTTAILLTIAVAVVLVCTFPQEKLQPQTSETSVSETMYNTHKEAFLTWLPGCYFAATFLVLGYGRKFFDIYNKLKK